MLPNTHNAINHIGNRLVSTRKLYVVAVLYLKMRG